MRDIKKSFIANGIVNHNSSDPNLQNQPKDKEYRRVYKCPPGYRFIEADFSQAELRIAAVFSDDKTMKEAFELGRDIHCTTLCKMFNMNYEEVVSKNKAGDPKIKKLRQRAKSVNFGVVYGETAFSLAEDLELELEEAEKFLDEYFKAFSGLGRWRLKTQDFTRKNGYTRTLWGRIRRFPELEYQTGISRPKLSAYMRQSMNTPVQGAASDYSLLALVAVDKYLEEGGFKSGIIAMVHDSIVIEAADDEIRVISPRIKHIMETVKDIGLKMEADIDVGHIWGFPDA